MFPYFLRSRHWLHFIIINVNEAKQYYSFASFTQNIIMYLLRWPGLIMDFYFLISQKQISNNESLSSYHDSFNTCVIIDT